ncbi:MAG: hypothetical protein M3Q08_08840 [Pseudomonadota bacterium]|nr:hypothetical protein [Pseudomonadota bacterium]
MKHELTRRAALAGLAGAPVSMMALGIPAAATAGEDRTAWDRAFAAYERATAADAAMDAQMEPIRRAYEKAAAQVPHASFECFNERGATLHRILRTDRPEDIIEARRAVTSRRDPTAPPQNEYIAACQKLLAARDARDAELNRIGERLGYNEGEDRSDALAEVAYDARWKLISDIPAPDLPALLWKLEQLLKVDEDDSVTPWSHDATQQTMADARRLLSQGRA